jgi:hypothetical protein
MISYINKLVQYLFFHIKINWFCQLVGISTYLYYGFKKLCGLYLGMEGVSMISYINKLVQYHCFFIYK